VGRPRALIAAALRQQAHQAPDHPVIPTGQSRAGAHETVSSARSMGPVFRQWHGAGGPGLAVAVADDCGSVWRRSSRWLGSPVAWDH
jgi:hypothetical protein